MTQDHNPYRPPTADVELAPETGEGRPVAGKGRRFATLLLDYVGFYILGAIVGIALYAPLGRAEAAAFYASGWSTLMSVFLVLGYYLFFEALWGRTPAKMVLGTVVTDLAGGTPTFGAIVKRTLARLVPFEAFTFFGERGFHDRASRTKVVYLR